MYNKVVGQRSHPVAELQPLLSAPCAEVYFEGSFDKENESDTGTGFESGDNVTGSKKQRLPDLRGMPLCALFII